jgi:Tol biopolymer transport system component
LKFAPPITSSSSAVASATYTVLTRTVHADGTYRLLVLALVLPFVGAADLGRAGEFNVDIVAVDLSGTQTNLTRSASFNASPAVARDGRVVFVSDRDAPASLYVMDSDGENVRRLDGAGYVVGDNEVLEASRPSWSPSADGVAFDTMYGPIEPGCLQHCFGWEVSVVGSDGGGLRQIAVNAREPAWSPDGRRIAFLSGVGITGYDDEAGGVTITRVDGSRSVVLSALNQDINAASGSGLAWSPSGDALAFQAQRASRGHFRVYIVGADGRGERLLAAGHDPSWSPNGKHLAFIDDCKLMTIDRSGKHERRLSRKGECVEAAAWSPKAALVAYLTGKSVAGLGFPQLLGVKTASADGRDIRTLMPPPSSPERLRSWSSPVWTRDGKRILIAIG